MGAPDAPDAPDAAPLVVSSAESSPYRSLYPAGRTTKAFYASKDAFIADVAHAAPGWVPIPLGFMLDSLRGGLPKNLLTDRRDGIFYSIGLYYLNLGRIAPGSNSEKMISGPCYFPSARSRRDHRKRTCHSGCVYALLDDTLGICYGEPCFTVEMTVSFLQPLYENTTYFCEANATLVGTSKTGSKKIKNVGAVRNAYTGEVMASADALFIQTSSQAKTYKTLISHRRRDAADDAHSQDEYRAALARRTARLESMASLRVHDDPDDFLFSLPAFTAAEARWARDDPFVAGLSRLTTSLKGCRPTHHHKNKTLDPIHGKAFLRVFADERLLCAPVYFLHTSEGHAHIAHGGCLGAAAIEAVRRAYTGHPPTASKVPWRIDSLMLRYRGQVPLRTTLRITLESTPSEDSVLHDRAVRTYRGALDSDDGTLEGMDSIVLYDEFVVVVSCSLDDIGAQARI